MVATPPIIIVVPVDPSRTSPNQRLHWGERSRRNKAAAWLAKEAWRKAGRPRATGPVTVDIGIRRGRKMDPDNAIAGLKPAIDGLFGGNVTPDDSTEWLTIREVLQQTGERWRKAPEVVFWIYEA